MGYAAHALQFAAQKWGYGNGLLCVRIVENEDRVAGGGHANGCGLDLMLQHNRRFLQSLYARAHVHHIGVSVARHITGHEREGRERSVRGLRSERGLSGARGRERTRRRGGAKAAGYTTDLRNRHETNPKMSATSVGSASAGPVLRSASCKLSASCLGLSAAGRVNPNERVYEMRLCSIHFKYVQLLTCC
jgi:hypothetical protein